MIPFTRLNAIAAPLPIANIDTDMIIPKQFLRTIKRTGLGVHAFDEMRYDENGRENPDFILNREPYRQAQILITGENFGCGSSREHAPWALDDMGIRCVIAESFADIFYNNCFKNGMIPVTLPSTQIQALMGRARDFPNDLTTIDLRDQTVKAGNLCFHFDIDPFRKHCLINGLDDIALTLENESDITAFEAADRQNRHWLYR